MKKYDIEYIDSTDENEQMDDSQLDEVAAKIGVDEVSYWIDILPGYGRDYFLESMKKVLPEGTEYISANDFINTLIESVSKGNVFAFKEFPYSLKDKKDILVFTDIEKFQDGSSAAEFFFDALRYRLLSNKKTILVGHAQVSGDITKKISKIVINDNEMKSNDKDNSDGDIVYRITIEVARLVREGY